jgi:hypothetical protein
MVGADRQQLQQKGFLQHARSRGEQSVSDTVVRDVLLIKCRKAPQSCFALPGITVGNLTAA